MLETRTPRLATRVGGRIRSTLSVSRGALGRRDSAFVFVIVTLLYLVTFLWAIGDLSFQSVGTDFFTVSDPYSRALEPAPGAYMHEPVALLDLWVARFLISPVNVALGLGVSLLVGVNLALSYLAVTQPKSCGLGAASGIFAAIPALLAGSACCGPALLVVLGITASSTLLTLFSWLLPIGVGLLLVSLVYVSGQIDPTAV
jgi:hypothetical protein